jgi:hypothetical protein
MIIFMRGPNFSVTKFLGTKIYWGPKKCVAQIRSGTISVIAKIQSRMFDRTGRLIGTIEYDRLLLSVKFKIAFPIKNNFLSGHLHQCLHYLHCLHRGQNSLQEPRPSLVKLVLKLFRCTQTLGNKFFWLVLNSDASTI